MERDDDQGKPTMLWMMIRLADANRLFLIYIKIFTAPYDTMNG